MKLAGEYTFDAPQNEVWEALLDPEVLAAVLPGCDKLELVDGVYEGVLKIKVGPVQGKFNGKVKLSDMVEPESYRMNVDGKGAPGFVKADAGVKLAAVSETQTTMAYEADAKVGGRIASVGQRLIDASAKAIIKQSLEGLHETIKARAAHSGSVAAAEEAKEAAAAAEAAAKAAGDAALAEEARKRAEAAAEAEAAAKAAQAEAARKAAEAGPSQSELARAVAAEVTNELIPAPARYALVGIIGIIIGYFIGSAT